MAIPKVAFLIDTIVILSSLRTAAPSHWTVALSPHRSVAGRLLTRRSIAITCSAARA
jgi:hypothetical protein